MELQNIDSSTPIYKLIGINYKFWNESIKEAMELFIRQNGDRFWLLLRSLKFKMGMLV